MLLCNILLSLQLTFRIYSNPQSFSSSSPKLAMEVIELKVDMVGIHEKRLRKCLSKLRGIERVEVDGNSQKVVVKGYAHRNKILKAVKRSGLKADLWTPQNELLHAYANVSSFRFNNFSFF
ncbi:hypothetical protein L6452_07976 [Arctium lappa]|uniref:Uncharacterized protein n=1 Tax=Arctium lappa TaxID=4217 RepID=A0ACB9DGE8_ARCLA|nr:hypothetical protein L6452_07976 [Arctium lappa]